MVKFLSKLGGKLKEFKDSIVLPFSKFFNWLHFKPVYLTIISLIAGFVAVYFLALGDTEIFLYWILVKIIFDGFDGSLARYQKKDSKLGFWLDYGSDRLITSAILVTIWIKSGMEVVYLIQIILFILVHSLYLRNKPKTMIIYCDIVYYLILSFSLFYGTVFHISVNSINLILLLASLL
ncbi:MAG: CDP-alcohol phosphatidyltransferase family protein [Candidatus Peregrinibacteria bacterium]|nr:CDP-alcohol phosphatidyltransferase family protein [Candidatus Peregrinibacteria bacterium]